MNNFISLKLELNFHCVFIKVTSCVQLRVKYSKPRLLPYIQCKYIVDELFHLHFPKISAWWAVFNIFVNFRISTRIRSAICWFEQHLASQQWCEWWLWQFKRSNPELWHNGWSLVPADVTSCRAQHMVTTLGTENQLTANGNFSSYHACKRF